MRNRFVWFECPEMLILVDMELGLIVGSITPQVDGRQMIRYGLHPDKDPMSQDMIDGSIAKAAGTIEGRILSFPTDDRVIRALMYMDTDSVSPTAQIRKETLNLLYGEAAAELHPEIYEGR